MLGARRGRSSKLRRGIAWRSRRLRHPTARGTGEPWLPDLHFDFGLPLNPVASTDLARYTALHIPASTQPSDAVTRLVPLRSLLGAIGWPDSEGLIVRFTAYGHSHGAWDGAAGYVEGSLARIVEAALGRPPMVPSVKDDPVFLCGMEFATLGEELAFFARRGLPLAEVGLEVLLQPGDLLVFDNLALAHGRRGTRKPGELHQRIIPTCAVGVAGQVGEQMPHSPTRQQRRPRGDVIGDLVGEGLQIPVRGRAALSSHARGRDRPRSRMVLLTWPVGGRSVEPNQHLGFWATHSRS